MELDEPRITRDQQRLIENYTELFQKVGLMVASFDLYDGLMCAKFAEKRATELVLVARHHKWLMDALKRFSGSNDYLEATLGYGVMAYALLAHHGRVPDSPILSQFGYGPLGTPEPDISAQAEQHYSQYAIPHE